MYLKINKMKKYYSLFLSLIFFNSIHAQISLWGLTELGGANNMGVVFEFNVQSNTITKKIDFAGATNGQQPAGSLAKVYTGKLYGMTQLGGASLVGEIFEYDHQTNTLTKKIDFNGSNGSRPSGSLLEVFKGKMYGITYIGGNNNMGVLFEYNHGTNVLTVKHHFDGMLTGKNPRGSLIKAVNGNLYGLTYKGGTNDEGVLFEYDAVNDTIYNRYNFGGVNGVNPWGSLCQAANGKLYGMTELGGTNNEGVLFEYDTLAKVFTKKIDFDSATSGRYPLGSLISATNGKLYGCASWGGANDDGVLFEYTPGASSVTKLHDFDLLTSGQYPYGALLQASNGKLYGLTKNGSVTNDGILFEYNITTSTFSALSSFANTNGSKPSYTQLLELPTIIGIEENEANNLMAVYPNPTTGEFYLELKANCKVLITDVLGNQIYSDVHSVGREKIDLSKESTGIYFVIVTSENKSATKKLIINK